MGSVYRKNNRWWIEYKDESNVRQQKPTVARTKTEARDLLRELEHQVDRSRFQLEERQQGDGGTVGQLMQWWLNTYSVKLAAHRRNTAVVTKHFVKDPVGVLTLRQFTPARAEEFLERKAQSLSRQSVNHLRRFLSRAWKKAKYRVDNPWRAPCPVAEIQAKRVPKHAFDFLRPNEVPRLFAALPPKWVNLFATALYTGMRKGELLGLRKTAIDWEMRQIYVERSYARDTTKGEAAEAIPIADALEPYLRDACDRALGELVFPADDGHSMRSEFSPLEDVLRRAMRHAGIVTGVVHVCRVKGCTHRVTAQDSELRRCPTHGRALWPKPQARPIRFHDLRHSTASLLIMAGANLAAVQRILRHSDPKITTETYAHLLPEFLRQEVNMLRGPVKTQPVPTAALPEDFPEPVAAFDLLPKVADVRGKKWRAVDDSNVRPAASETAARGYQALADACKPLETLTVLRTAICVPQQALAKRTEILPTAALPRVEDGWVCGFCSYCGRDVEVVDHPPYACPSCSREIALIIT